MIILRLFALCVVLLVVTACRSQNESLTSPTPSPDTVVSSTPPFQTKEPERYHAVRTVTAVSGEGRSVVTKSFVARDGDSRRYETTGMPKNTVHITTPEGDFFLLPDEKVYAVVTDEMRLADKEDEELESSPDALLHTEAGSTSYQKLGNEVIVGRNTNKYRIVVNSPAPANVSQSETLMWIDEALQMPIRSETKSADYHVTMEISEIKLEVDKSLFKIPEGYQKVTFAELRKRLIAPAQPDDE